MSAKIKNNDAFITEGFTSNITSGTSNLNLGTTENCWNEPFRAEVNEYFDKIEMIYKQKSNTTLDIYHPRPPEERVFKIVFSCVDGKWNKSEPIYVKIISAKSESYEF